MGDQSTTAVVAEIAAERRRQVDVWDYTTDHDDEHEDGKIALAAICYATPVNIYRHQRLAEGHRFADPWPWEMRDDRRVVEEGEHAGANYAPPPSAYTPTQRRRLLVKAAALMVAEIERLDRADRRQPAAEG